MTDSLLVELIEGTSKINDWLVAIWVVLVFILFAVAANWAKR